MIQRSYDRFYKVFHEEENCDLEAKEDPSAVISSVLEVWHNKFETLKYISADLEAEFARIETSIDSNHQVSTSTKLTFPTIKSLNASDSSRVSMIKEPSRGKQKKDYTVFSLDRDDDSNKSHSEDPDDQMQIIKNCKFIRRTYAQGTAH